MHICVMLAWGSGQGRLWIRCLKLTSMRKSGQLKSHTTQRVRPPPHSATGHIHVHTQAPPSHRPTHAHTRAHTRTHARTPTHIHMCTHTHMHVCARTHTHTHTHTTYLQGMKAQYPPGGGKHSVEVDGEDLGRLEDLEFLNDTVIDLYIK